DLRLRRCAHRLYVHPLVAHAASQSGDRRRRELRTRSAHAARAAVELCCLRRIWVIGSLAALPARARTSAVEYSVPHARSRIDAKKFDHRLHRDLGDPYRIPADRLQRLSESRERAARASDPKGEIKMRRVIGIVMMLAGAYALYWAYKGAGGQIPANLSFTNP